MLKRDLNFEFDMKSVTKHFREIKTCTSILLYITQDIEAQNYQFCSNNNNDLNLDVIKSLYLLMHAQLQEISLQIGIYRRNSFEYLAGICNDIQSKYKTAYQLNNNSKIQNIENLQNFLLLKYYTLYALAYGLHAKSFLVNNQCGIAIKSYRHGKSIFENAIKISKEYVS